jgi:glucose/arabinose dehydrogenase
MTITRRQIETTLAALLALITAIAGISARDNEPPLGPKFVTLEKIGRFTEPVHMAQPPGLDSPLFVVERRGRVRTIVSGHVRREPFLDIRDAVRHTGKGGEQGLLSIAFPPDYAATGYFYVAYTDRRDALRVVEFRRSSKSPLRATRKSARLLLRIPQPTPKHHGGLVLFGPDKELYIGVGDGGPSGDPGDVAQRKRVLLGKLLRISPRPGPPRSRRRGRPRRAPYTIPADNPLVGRRGRDEIFAYGLRNPWRFSFDRSPTGDLLTIADVGDQRFEEINILPLSKARGANFGWSYYEGGARFRRGLKRRRTVLPVYTYPHGRRCSVVGGYVVRDPRLSRIKGREIVGRYIFGDFCSKRLFAFQPRRGKAGRERSFRFEIPGVTSFAQDRAGRIHVLSYEGPIYRLDPRRKRVSP